LFIWCYSLGLQIMITKGIRRHFHYLHGS